MVARRTAAGTASPGEGGARSAEALRSASWRARLGSSHTTPTRRRFEGGCSAASSAGDGWSGRSGSGAAAAAPPPPAPSAPSIATQSLTPSGRRTRSAPSPGCRGGAPSVSSTPGPARRRSTRSRSGPSPPPALGAQKYRSLVRAWERREPKARFVPARSSTPRIQEAPGDAAAATPRPRSESAHGPLRTTCSRPRQLRAPAAELPRPGTLCSVRVRSEFQSGCLSSELSRASFLERSRNERATSATR